MRRAGFATVNIIAAVAIAGALAAAVVGVRAYLDGVDARAHDRGIAEERARWQSRESIELTATNAKVIELESRYRALEQKSASDAAAIDANFQRRTKNVEAEKDRFIDDVLAGRIRLRVDLPGSAAGGEAPNRGSAAALGAPTGGRDGAAQAELPGAVSANLYGLMAEADKVVEQLGACQAIVLKDREVCK